MDYTTNYHLPQWVESDRIMMEDFNEAMAAIEKGLSDGKNNVETNTEQMQTQLEALSAALGTGGKNARLQWGSYMGTGVSSSSQPATISFDFAPAVVFIYYNYSGAYGMITLLRSVERMVADTFYHKNILVSWSDHEVSFYPEEEGGNPYFNVSSYPYYYVAVGYDSSHA